MAGPGLGAWPGLRLHRGHCTRHHLTWDDAGLESLLRGMDRDPQVGIDQRQPSIGDRVSEAVRCLEVHAAIIRRVV